MNDLVMPELLMQAGTDQGIGREVLRKEDKRLLLGQGKYVGDMRMPDMLEVAFVRSPVAHARLGQIEKPPGLEHLVYTMADMTSVRPIIAASSLPGFKISAQYPLAQDKVRHVGELLSLIHI